MFFLLLEQAVCGILILITQTLSLSYNKNNLLGSRLVRRKITKGLPCLAALRANSSPRADCPLTALHNTADIVAQIEKRLCLTVLREIMTKLDNG